MLGDGRDNRMPHPSLNSDRVEVARTFCHARDGSKPEMLQSDFGDHGMDHGKSESVRGRDFHKPSVLEFGDYPWPDIFLVKPFLERLAHSHVFTRQQCRSLMQRFWKIASELFRNFRYRAEGNPRAAESVIECFRLQAAGGRFIREDKIEPVRLQLLDQRSNLR